MTTNAEVVARARLALNDESAVRWADGELLGWLQNAMFEVMLYREDAAATAVKILLAPNTVTQSTTSGVLMHAGYGYTAGTAMPGDRLIRVVRNLGANGSTEGGPITVVSRDILDSQNPLWPAEVASTSGVLHYTYDPLEPTKFSIYPMVTGTWYVEAIVVKSPDLNLTTTVQVPDEYIPALVNFILFRAHSKDAEYAQNANLAAGYYKSFVESLGVTLETAKSINPNIIGGGFNPNVPKS